MTGVGRDQAVTEAEIYREMEADDRRAWSAKDLAAHFDVNKQTTRKRLESLLEAGWVEAVEISNVTAYFVPEHVDLDREEQHRQSLVDEFSDKFVGLETDPTEVTSGRKSDEPGDKIQLEVRGEPGQWAIFQQRRWGNRRDDLEPVEVGATETQALISGVLREKATVPIEHVDYPDDYDLELNIGGQFEHVDGRDHPLLIAGGLDNHLIKPCNEALFLTEISIDWISPMGEGRDEDNLESVDIDIAESLEDVDEWRAENVPEPEGNPEDEWEI